MKVLFPFIMMLIFGAKTNAQLFCFNPYSSYDCDLNTATLVNADFNADGKMDLAAVNISGSVTILLGNGMGGFSAPSNTTSGVLPHTACSADYNSDGKVDLATFNSGPGNVSIMLGSGTGSFVVSTAFSTGTYSPLSRIATNDFNGDEKADLIISSSFNYAMIALGNGDGTFATPVHIPVDNGTKEIAIGDFNADGKKDLALTTYNISFHVSVMLGNGIGGFGSVTNYSIGDSPECMIIADFNGDTISDLATANIGNNTVGNISVLMGNGDGSFTNAVNYSIGDSTIARSLCAADLNNDGKIDLAAATIANHNVSNISLLAGDGTGVFDSPVVLDVDSFPNAIIASDFNNDGKIDLAASSSKSNIDFGKVSVLLNCNPTNIDKTTSNNQVITFYPNPTKGILYFKSNSLPQNASLDIYNDIGQKVYSVANLNTLENNKIDLSYNRSGIYSILFKSDNNMFLQKIVIN